MIITTSVYCSKNIGINNGETHIPIIVDPIEKRIVCFLSFPVEIPLAS